MVNLREYMVVSQVEESFRKILLPGIDIITEYRTYGGRRVDLVIVRDFEILACIEVKSSLLNRHQLKDAQEQVLEYQKDTSSFWAVVTDGNHYYVHSISDENGNFVKKENAEAVLKAVLGLQSETDKAVVMTDETSEINLLKQNIVGLCKTYDNSISTIGQVKELLENISIANCKVSPSRFTFDRSFENHLFQALLGSYNKDEVVRYVPLKSAYRSLNEKTIVMVSLVGMNDMSECYYADQYFATKKGDDTSKGILPAESKLLNNTYILSCNNLSMEDHLTMWRLYGDKCKGACIKMIIEKEKLEKDNSFILAPVSYGEKDGDNMTHPKLDFVNDIFSLKIGNRSLTFETWCYWKHFFKDHRYSDENEVRLLYTGKGCGERKWILTDDSEIPCPMSVFPIKTLPNHSNDFPLTLSKILIGSRCSDQETKKRQLEELIQERNRGYEKGFAIVDISKIDNFR